MSIVPSAPPDASGTVRGFVNLVAQTFAGAKTFLATIVASAGIQVASLFNTNGTGASDVGVKVGVSTADGSVNSNATLFMVSTGIGGTEVQRLGVRTAGQASGFTLFGVGTNGALVINNSVGTQLVWGANALTFDGSNMTFANSGIGGIIRIGDTGAISTRGTDDSANVGNRTVDKPSGINTLASGATSVTITNSLVPNPATAKVRLNLSWRGDVGARWWWTQNNGSFTVNVSAAPGSNVSFDWEICGLL